MVTFALWYSERSLYGTLPRVVDSSYFYTTTINQKIKKEKIQNASWSSFIKKKNGNELECAHYGTELKYQICTAYATNTAIFLLIYQKMCPIWIIHMCVFFCPKCKLLYQNVVLFQSHFSPFHESLCTNQPRNTRGKILS